jgi:enoyl-CoA hydratase
MSSTIEDLNGRIIVGFSSPEIRNPLSVNVINRLHDLLGSIAARNIKKLIFTGADDVFASGANLREISQLDSKTALEFAIRGQSLMNKIANLPMPTVAAINGYCLGGALDLTLACNKRIASPNAVFSHPGVSLGIITGWGGTQRLPRLIGETRAMEMFLTAGRFNAEWALQAGLIDEIADDPLDRALKS